MITLEIKTLCKSFGSKEVLNNIELNIKKGETISLIGPNGSGKTTIVKIIVGLLSKSFGTVKVASINIEKYPKKTKSLIGYIPDEPTIWPMMTGIEFLRFTGKIFSMNPKEIEKRINELLSLYHIEDIEHMYFENLSRGNRQKLSFIAALLHKPKILIIDEPIVGLDPTSIEITKKVLKDFTIEEGSVLLVTHTLKFAEEVSDRIGMLHRGFLLHLDTFKNLQKKANVKGGLDEIYEKLIKF